MMNDSTESSKLEALLKEVLKVFLATPREYSELEWDMTDERLAILEAIRAEIEVL